VLECLNSYAIIQFLLTHRGEKFMSKIGQHIVWLLDEGKADWLHPDHTENKDSGEIPGTEIDWDAKTIDGVTDECQF
jgi:hypothetical protein